LRCFGFESTYVELITVEKTEEGVNRTAVALSLLTRIIFAYPFIQKKAIFGLLQLVKTKGLDMALTERALDSSSSSATRTMACHVSFLLSKWLSAGYLIEEFPHKLFGCESIGDFYTTFRSEISVELFQRNDDDSMEKLAKHFDLQKIDLIKVEHYFYWCL
jgi:hypothetical protein